MVEVPQLPLSSRGLPESYIGDVPKPYTPLPPPYIPQGTIEPVRFDPLSDVKRFYEIADIKAGGSRNVIDLIRGILQAIPSYVGEVAKEGFTKAQIRLGKPLGEPEPLPLPSGTQIETPAVKFSQLGGEGGKAGTYFTPAGIPILLSGGLSYVTPTGRTQIEETGQAIEEQYGVPKQLAYGIPALEVGLGAWGLKGTNLNPFRPVVREEKIIVDVKPLFGKGYTRVGSAGVRKVGIDVTGKPYVVEEAIPIYARLDVGVEGTKRILTTPFREFFGLKPLYAGTRAEQRATGGFISRALELPTNYQRAIRLLKEQGYTTSQIRQLLRQTRPQYKRIESLGLQTVKQVGEQQPVRLFTGEQVTTYVAGEKGGVKFLKKKPQKISVDELAEYWKTADIKIADFGKVKQLKTGKIVVPAGKKEIDLIAFERLETKPTLFGESLLPKELRTKAGKTTETFKGIVGAEYLKEVKPYALVGTSGELKGFVRTPELTYARFKTADISRKIIPKERRLLTNAGGIADISRAEPKFTIYDETIKSSIGFMGGGKKSSPQFLEKLYKGIEQAKAETGLSLLKVKPTKPAKAPKVKHEAILPETTTGVGLYSLGSSVVYGKPDVLSGIYGGTVSGIPSSDFSRGFFAGLGKTIPETQAQTDILSTTTDRTLTGEATGTLTSQIGTEKLIELERLRTPSLEITRPREMTIERLEQTPKERLAERVVQIERQAQREKQITTTKIETPRQPPRRPPKTPPIIPKIKKLLSELKKKAVGGEEFEVFGRRFGVDKSLGTFTTQEKAEKAGIKFAKGTLGASFFVKKEGQKIPFEKLKLSSEFRPSKIESGRIVQMREARLTTGGERREIKQSRRKVKWI